MTTHELDTASNHKSRTGLPQPPYSPELAPSDLHVFVPLKYAVRRKRFWSDDDVIEEAKKWLRVQNSNWYKKGIGALVSYWLKAVEIDGDYVEK
jgi:hypothetical protein